MKIYKTSLLKLKRKFDATKGLKVTSAEQIFEEIANFGAENRDIQRETY